MIDFAPSPLEVSSSGRRARRSGFTLVEMMVTSAIGLIVVLGVLGSFTQHRRTYAQKKLEQALQQNVRTAMSQVQRDLRTCSSGLVMGTSSLGSWFSELSGVTSLPHVIEGGTSGDQLITAGHTGTPVGALTNGITYGATGLDLTVSTELELPYLPQVGDVLVLGSLEAVKVTGVSGNRVTFTTDPGGSSTGTHLAYPSGIDVYELNTVTYSLATESGVQGLKREDSRFTYASEADKFIALHIEEFELANVGDQTTVTIQGKTASPLAGYAGEADEYPRYALSSQAMERNASPQLTVSSWDQSILLGATATPAPSGTVTPSPTASPEVTPEPTASPTATPVPTTRPHDSGKAQHCWCFKTSEQVNHP